MNSRSMEGARLRRHVLRGAVLVFITAGYSSKRFIFGAWRQPARALSPSRAAPRSLAVRELASRLRPRRRPLSAEASPWPTPVRQCSRRLLHITINQRACLPLLLQSGPRSWACGLL